MDKSQQTCFTRCGGPLTLSNLLLLLLSFPQNMLRLWFMLMKKAPAPAMRLMSRSRLKYAVEGTRTRTRARANATAMATAMAMVVMAGSLLLAGCGGNEDSALKAVVSADVTSGMAPLSVQFHGDYKGAKDGGVYDFSWQFGDGSTSSSRLRNPVHTYLEPGDYTAKLVVTERSDGDSAFAEIQIQVGGRADLTSDGLVFTPDQVTLRDNIKVSFLIRNDGFKDAPKSAACLLISETAQLSPETTWQLDQVDVDELEPGEEFLVEDWEVKVQGALRSRVYWVAVKADCGENVDEASRNNNVDLASTRLSVSSPDDAPDVLVADLKFAPTTTFPSSLVRVELNLRNGGTRQSGPFNWRLYLSEDENLSLDAIQEDSAEEGQDAGDAGGEGQPEQDLYDGHILLANGQLDVLPAETGIIVNTSFNVPDYLESRRYFLIALVDPDDTVEEMDESNNVHVAQAMLSVIDGRVDGVDVLPTQIYAGEYQISVETNLHALATICNRGTRSAGPFMVRFAFSEDAEWSDDDVAVGVANLTRGLEPGLEACKDISLVQPLLPTMRPGQYHLCVMADPVNSIPETSKDNNWACDNRRVAVGSSAQVDLAVDAVEFQPGVIRAGELMEVGFRVENLGTDKSGAFEIGVFISERQVFDSGIRLLETLQVSDLKGGTGQDMAALVSAPLDLDARIENYYVGVMVDPWNQLVGETTKENNLSWAATFARITGGMGGCRPDAMEPNNSMGDAIRLSPGFYEDMGRCGEDDWFAIPLRSGYGFFAAIDFSSSRGALGLELYKGDGVTLIERSLRPGVSRETVLLPLTTVDTVLYLRVTSAPLDVANMYDLEIAVMEPPPGVDVVVGSVVPESSRFNRGTPLVVNLPVTNMGTEDCGPLEVALNLMSVDGGGGVEVERIPIPEGLASMETVHLQAILYGPPGTQAGMFRVFAVADPEQVTGDIDHQNNSSSTSLVQYVVPPEGCLDDIYDPNESWHTAKEVLPGIITAGLFVCQGFDDWFSFQLEQGMQANVRAHFLNEDGDIDLELYGPDVPVLIEHSRTTEDTEALDFTAASGGTYWVRALLHSGPYPVNGYRLTLNVSQCESDDSEVNDEPESSAQLDGVGLTGRTMCIGDVDYYRVTLFEGVPVTIRANLVEQEQQSGLQLPVSLVLFAVSSEVEGGGELVEVASTYGDGGTGGGGGGGEGGEGGVIDYIPQMTGEYVVKVSQQDGLVLHYDLVVEGLDGVDLVVDGLALEPGTGLESGGLVDVAFSVRNQRAGEVPPFRVRIGAWQGAPLGKNESEEWILPVWSDPGLLILHEMVIQGGLTPGQVLNDRVRVAIPAAAGTGALQMVVLVEPLAGELNTADNGAVAMLNVVPQCFDDALEPNNTPVQAWPLDVGTYPLAVCGGGADYFSIVLSECGALDAVITFNHQAGDLDLIIMDETGEVLLAVASSGTGLESVTLEGLEAGSYLVGVLPFNGASNAYLLEVSVRAQDCATGG